MSCFLSYKQIVAHTYMCTHTHTHTHAYTYWPWHGLVSFHKLYIHTHTHSYIYIYASSLHTDLCIIFLYSCACERAIQIIQECLVGVSEQNTLGRIHKGHLDICMYVFICTYVYLMCIHGNHTCACLVGELEPHLLGRIHRDDDVGRMWIRSSICPSMWTSRSDRGKNRFSKFKVFC